MGISGLFSYILDNADVFLEKFELRDTVVVIDGNNLAHDIAFSVPRWQLQYGGDYDSLYATAKAYFLNLRACNVRPIVLFDGPHDKQKDATCKKRFKDKLVNLKVYLRTTVKQLVTYTPPMFLYEVLMSVLNDLRISYSVCLNEADPVLAALAKVLDCPVMSNDSDFFVYDVAFIPLNTVSGAVKADERNGAYIPCRVFHVEKLLGAYDGLQRDCLPLIACVLGNDYNEFNAFSQFYNHLTLKKLGKSHGVKYVRGVDRVRALLKWFQSETAESAKQKIMSHISKNQVRAVSYLFEHSTRVYCGNVDMSHLSQTVRNVLKKKGFIVGTESHTDDSRGCVFEQLPVSWQENYLSSAHSSTIMSIADNVTHNMPVQIEDIRQESSHAASMPLLNIAMAMTESYMCKKSAWKLRTRAVKTSVKVIELSTDGGGFERYSRGHWEAATAEERRGLLCDALELSDNDRAAIRVFDGSWILYAMSVIYWARRVDDVTFEHVRALLAAAIVCQLRAKRSRSTRRAAPVATQTGLLKLVLTSLDPAERCALMKSTSVTLRKKALSGLAYDVSVVHKFAVFQSVMLHASLLNNMLGRPVPNVEFEAMFCGSLVYLFYYTLGKARPALQMRVDEGNMPGTAKALRTALEPLVECIPLCEKFPTACRSGVKNSRNT